MQSLALRHQNPSRVTDIHSSSVVVFLYLQSNSALDFGDSLDEIQISSRIEPSRQNGDCIITD